MAEKKSYIYEIIVDTQKGTASINGTDVALKKLGGTIRGLTKESTEMGNALKAGTDKTGLAGAAVVELGRTISDANYGMTAMANNISQLTTLFVTLIATTGGVKNAFVAMKAAFMGPLGIIVAFQILVAVMEHFAIEAKKTVKGVNEIAKAYKNAATELELQLELSDKLTEGERQNIQDRIHFLREEAKVRAQIAAIQKLQGELVELEMKQAKDFVPWYQAMWEAVKSGGTRGGLFNPSTEFLENVLGIGEANKQEQRDNIQDKIADIIADINPNAVDRLVAEKTKGGKRGKDQDKLYGQDSFGMDQFLLDSLGIPSMDVMNKGLQNLLVANEIKLGILKDSAKNEKQINADLKRQREEDLEHRLIMLDSIGDGMISLGYLVGRTTQEGKAIAAAGALIETYSAITKTLAAFAGKPIPGYAIAQAVATGLFGFAQVKKIYSVNVPKGSGGGGAAGGVPSSVPIQQPDFNIVGVARQNQLRETIDGALGRPIRAYVTTRDIRSGEELDRNIVRGASVG